MIQSNFENFLATTSLNKDDVKTILESFKTIELPKGTHLLKENEICNFVAFIESGLVIYYNLSENGDEKICDFALEHQWVSQYKSLISNTKSPISIKTFETTIIQKILYDDLKKLTKEIPAFDAIIKQIVDDLLVQMLQRTDDFQHLNAEERYHKFVKNHFEIVQRVPQYYLASFLGIKPQSLSRIRKNNSQI